jgi:hypothetical protein
LPCCSFCSSNNSSGKISTRCHPTFCSFPPFLLQAPLQVGMLPPGMMLFGMPPTAPMAPPTAAPPPPAPPAVPEPDPQAVVQLSEMGFGEPVVRKALLLHRNELEAALNWLLQHGDDPAAGEPLTDEQLRQVGWALAGGDRMSDQGSGRSCCSREIVRRGATFAGTYSCVLGVSGLRARLTRRAEVVGMGVAPLGCTAAGAGQCLLYFFTMLRERAHRARARD